MLEIIFGFESCKVGNFEEGIYTSWGDEKIQHMAI
jgi:hypothetical protein